MSGCPWVTRTAPAATGAPTGARGSEGGGAGRALAHVERADRATAGHAPVARRAAARSYGGTTDGGPPGGCAPSPRPTSSGALGEALDEFCLPRSRSRPPRSRTAGFPPDRPHVDANRRPPRGEREIPPRPDPTALAAPVVGRPDTSRPPPPTVSVSSRPRASDPCGIPPASGPPTTANGFFDLARAAPSPPRVRLTHRPARLRCGPGGWGGVRSCVSGRSPRHPPAGRPRSAGAVRDRVRRPAGRAGRQARGRPWPVRGSPA